MAMHDLIASYGFPLLGGVMIGLSASLLLLTHGRVAGVAGLFGGLFLPGHDARSFRIWFIAGLVAAGLALSWAYPAAFSLARSPSMAVVGVAGLLVGYGTRLGGGCTSGHGICGRCRLSVRSVVATMTFMAAGMVTVFVVNHLGGDPQ
jgi:uncharacterized membrane protein YedE/YeeE